MGAILRALATLFRTGARISFRAARGLFQQGASRYAKNAVRALDITISGRRIAYHELSEFDQAVVDETVDYCIRFATEYVDHHDENTQYRVAHHELEDLLESHANEVMTAAKRALYSKLRSHGYDAAAASSRGLAVFLNDDLIKQLVLGVIAEISDDIENN